MSSIDDDKCAKLIQQLRECIEFASNAYRIPPEVSHLASALHGHMQYCDEQTNQSDIEDSR